MSGPGGLKPHATLYARKRKAGTVDWLVQKQSLLGDTGSKFSSGCRKRFRTLTTAGQSRGRMWDENWCLDQLDYRV